MRDKIIIQDNRGRDVSVDAKTSIKKNCDRYYYKQSFIKKKPFRHYRKTMLLDKLSILATHLTEVMNLGFVHGDLNMKNIIFNGELFVIVDFEPSLFQKKIE